MNRPGIRSLLRWLLPILVARALIPAGFMLSAGADGVGLMLCPGATHHVSSLPHAGHDGDADVHAGHHQQPASSDHDNAVCPFALAASMASIDVPASATLPDSPSDDRFVPPAVAHSHTFTVRAHLIRGPPFLV